MDPVASAHCLAASDNGYLQLSGHEITTAALAHTCHSSQPYAWPQLTILVNRLFPSLLQAETAAVDLPKLLI